MAKQTRTQLRYPQELHEQVRELAHEKRQSRNQFITEAIEEKVEREHAAREPQALTA